MKVYEDLKKRKILICKPVQCFCNECTLKVNDLKKKEILICKKNQKYSRKNRNDGKLKIKKVRKKGKILIWNPVQCLCNKVNDLKKKRNRF